MVKSLKKINKILLIRFSAIGDIVLTSALVRCVKEQIPNCQIDFLTKEQNVNLVKTNPYITTVIGFDKHLPYSFYRRIIRQNKYDYIIDLQNNLRSYVTCLFTNIQRLKYKKNNFGKYVLIHFHKDILCGKHVVDRYFDTIKNILPINNDQKGLDYFLSDKDIVPDLPKENFIAIAVGAGHYTKTIPINILINIIKGLSPIPIVLLGSQSDTKTSKNILNQLINTYSFNIIDYCGKLSLNQSAFVIKTAEILISGDTGLMHISSCFHTNTITLWGNTCKEFGMSAYYGNESDRHNLNHNFRVEGLKCSPCSHIGYEACPKKHFACMQQQKVEDIVSCAKNIINKQ